MSFIEMEHTADVKMHVEAECLDELFSEAARAMMNVMYGSPGSNGISHPIRVNAPDLVALMHAFLSEILYITDTEGLVVSGASVRVKETCLEGRLAGEPFQAEKHRGGCEIKGISLSGLQIIREEGTYIMEVLFDV
ncbi:MAG: archease [Methanolinea sp.]|nr:archease [Methanolinea sp.]